MKICISNFLPCFLFAVSCFGGVPVKFTVETSRADVQEIPCYHGETLDFEITFKNYGKDLILPTNEAASVFWQTNGMSAFFWRTNNVSVVSNRMTATFTPAMDPGTGSCFGFLGIPRVNYRASFVLRFKNSPGTEPKQMEWPYRDLDFSKIVVLNPPYYLKAESDANDTATLRAAETYANTRDSITLSSANAYANTQDLTKLTESKNYTDTKSSQTLSYAYSYADSGDAATLASAKGYTDTATADLFSKTGGVITGLTQFTNSCYFDGFTTVDHLRFYDVGTSSVLADIFYSPHEDGLVFRTYDLIGDGFLHFWYTAPQGIWVKDFIWLDNCEITSSVTNRLVTDFGISNVYTKAETDTAISAAVSGIATAANVTNIAEYVVSTNGFLTAVATNALASVAHTGAYGDLSGAPTIPAADYALTNLTGEAVALASGEIGNVTLGASQTNLNITLDFAASPDRSGDCMLLAICAADTRLAVGPAETVDILGTLDTLKAGTNVVSVTRLKVVGTTSLVMVNVKEVK